MNPIERMHPDTATLVNAGRELAWNSGADIDVMEGLVTKVVARAKANMIRRLLLPAVNDQGDDPG